MSLPEPEASQLSANDGQSQSQQGDGEEMQVLGEDTKTSGGGETSQGVEDEGGTDPNPKGQGAGDGEGKAADDGTETKKKRERRELERGEGRSIFPFARVQRTLKADKDLPIVMKEATFLISLATEEFIKRFSQAIQRVADKERRATVQQRDVATVVSKVEEYTFLEELLGWHTITQATKPKRKPKALEKRDEDAEPTMMDAFVVKSGRKRNGEGGGEGDEDGREGEKEEEEEEEEEGQDEVVMNEDGTIVLS